MKKSEANRVDFFSLIVEKYGVGGVGGSKIETWRRDLNLRLILRLQCGFISPPFSVLLANRRFAFVGWNLSAQMTLEARSGLCEGM